MIHSHKAKKSKFLSLVNTKQIQGDNEDEPNFDDVEQLTVQDQDQ